MLQNSYLQLWKKISDCDAHSSQSKKQNKKTKISSNSWDTLFIHVFVAFYGYAGYK